MNISFYALITGVVFDFIFGDPHWLPHPVRLIGAFISKLELWICSMIQKKLNQAHNSIYQKQYELFGGAFLVCIVLSSVTMISFFLLWMANRVSPVLRFIVESVMCYQIMATKALKVESMNVWKALKQDNLEEGRKAVSMIVGRDTASLEKEAVIRATVETIAENTSDGCIAPLFYSMLGGAPLGLCYKAINTMDSMIGYQTKQYCYFGRFAAKLDDIVNWIPARISAYFIILVTIFSRQYNTKNAILIYKRDKRNHKSPNSAHTEAAMAGALRIQLGGSAFYFGVLHKKQTIGDRLREIELEDIKRANQLLYATVLLAICLIILIQMVFFI